MKNSLKRTITIMAFTSFFIHYPLNATPEHLTLPDNALGKILADLHSIDQDTKLFNFFRMLELTGKISTEVSLIFRKNSPLGVTTKEDTFFLLDEALQSGIQIHKFSNPSYALKKGKNHFYKYILSVAGSPISSEIKNRTFRSPKIPNQTNIYEKIQDKQEFIYLNKLNLGSLLESLPTNESNQQKLAAVLTELLIWAQVKTQV